VGLFNRQRITRVVNDDELGVRYLFRISPILRMPNKRTMANRCQSVILSLKDRTINSGALLTMVSVFKVKGASTAS
jgi:hypothetical protein